MTYKTKTARELKTSSLLLFFQAPADQKRCAGLCWLLPAFATNGKHQTQLAHAHKVLCQHLPLNGKRLGYRWFEVVEEVEVAEAVNWTHPLIDAFGRASRGKVCLENTW